MQKSESQFAGVLIIPPILTNNSKIKNIGGISDIQFALFELYTLDVSEMLPFLKLVCKVNKDL